MSSVNATRRGRPTVDYETILSEHPSQVYDTERPRVVLNDPVSMSRFTPCAINILSTLERMRIDKNYHEVFQLPPENKRVEDYVFEIRFGANESTATATAAAAAGTTDAASGSSSSAVKKEPNKQPPPPSLTKGLVQQAERQKQSQTPIRMVLNADLMHDEDSDDRI